MHRGYIKLWRKTLDSGLLQNPNLWTFFSYCMLRASHKKRKELINGKMIEIEQGQFIFGRKQASIDLRMSEQTIRTCLKNLEKLEILTSKSTNRFSLVTLTNWGLHQPENDELTSQLTSNQPATNQQLTSNQPATNHKQELKNLRIKELENNSSQATPTKICKLYYKICQERMNLTLAPKLTFPRNLDLTRLLNKDDYKPEMFWITYFNIVASSDFLCGKVGKFKANFEWLITEANIHKVLEGNYQNKKGTQPKSKMLTVQEHNAKIQQEIDSGDFTADMNVMDLMFGNNDNDVMVIKPDEE